MSISKRNAMTDPSVNLNITLNHVHRSGGIDVGAMLAALRDLFALADVPLDTTDPRFEEFGSRVTDIGCRIEKITGVEIPDEIPDEPPVNEAERPGFPVQTMVGLVTQLFALADVPLDTTDPRFKEFGDKAGHIACCIDEILDLDVG